MTPRRRDAERDLGGDVPNEPVPRHAVRIVNVRGADFEIAAADTRPMINLLLRRQRQKSGLSLAAVAERLGAKSRNAYARYEQSATAPTVEKLVELLHAIAPDHEILVDLAEPG